MQQGTANQNERIICCRHFPGQIYQTIALFFFMNMGKMPRQLLVQGQIFTRPGNDLSDRKVEILTHAVNAHYLAAVQYRLMQAMVGQRLLVSGEAMTEHNQWFPFQFFQTHIQRRIKRHGRIRTEILLMQTMIHMRATQSAQQGLEQKQFFVAGLSGNQSGQLVCTVTGQHFFQSGERRFQGFGPGDFRPLTL